MTLADQARKTNRPAIDQRDAPTAAEDPEDRIRCGHTKVTPHGEFESARNDYKVVVNTQDWSVDEAATAELRK